MNWVTGLAIYFVIWWVVLFMVLPFRIRTQADLGNVVPGSAQSAPARPQLLWKALWTTVIAAVLFAGLVALNRSGVTLDSIPFLPRFEEMGV